MTVRTPLLVVFSAQRTGSNHLFDLLAAREGVASLNEVFNGVTLGLTDEVKALRKEGWDNWADYAALAAEHPVEALKFVDRIKDTRLAALKIQPRHIAMPGPAEELIRAATGNVFLRRNPLAVWISREQARETRKWANTNTESAFVTFDGESFAGFVSVALRKLERLEEMCSDVDAPLRVITYGELLRLGTPENLWNELYTAFPAIEPEPIRNDFVPLFAKQDTRRPFDRLANPDEARAWLDARGLTYIIDNDDDFSPRSVLDAVADVK